MPLENHHYLGKARTVTFLCMAIAVDAFRRWSVQHRVRASAQKVLIMLVSHTAGTISLRRG